MLAASSFRSDHFRTGEEVATPDSVFEHEEGEFQDLLAGGPSEAVLLDTQTANLLVTVFDTLSKKETFQLALDKLGVVRLVDKCWRAVK